MTKKDFLWCLARCTGSPTFSLRRDSDGWVHPYHITITCYAKGAPQRLPSGEPIGVWPGRGFVVDGFRGGSNIQREKRQRAKVRAETALAKYRRWAAEVPKAKTAQAEKESDDG